MSPNEPSGHALELDSQVQYGLRMHSSCWQGPEPVMQKSRTLRTPLFCEPLREPVSVGLLCRV